MLNTWFSHWSQNSDCLLHRVGARQVSWDLRTETQWGVGGICLHLLWDMEGVMATGELRLGLKDDSVKVFRWPCVLLHFTHR